MYLRKNSLEAKKKALKYEDIRILVWDSEFWADFPRDEKETCGNRDVGLQNLAKHSMDDASKQLGDFKKNGSTSYPVTFPYNYRN